MEQTGDATIDRGRGRHFYRAGRRGRLPTGWVGDASKARQEARDLALEAERHQPASERAAVGAPRQERREAQIGEGDALKDQVVEYRPPREGRGPNGHWLRVWWRLPGHAARARQSARGAQCELFDWPGWRVLTPRAAARGRRSAAGLALPAGRDAGARARAGDDTPRAEHCRHCRHGRQVGMRRADHDV